VSLRVGGVDCLDSVEYCSERKLVCVTKASVGTLEGVIEIKTLSGGVGQSTVIFHFNAGEEVFLGCFFFFCFFFFVVLFIDFYIFFFSFFFFLLFFLSFYIFSFLSPFSLLPSPFSLLPSPFSFLPSRLHHSGRNQGNKC